MKNVLQKTNKSNLIILTNALENAKNGILVIPKEYDTLTKEDGNLIETYDIHTILFEEGSELRSVDRQAFYSKKHLKSIDFRNCLHLETIGMWAFARCSNLESVLFAEENNLKYVKAYAFRSTAIRELSFNNSQLELVGDYAFYNNEQLKILDMSRCKELKTIGQAITNGSRQLELWDMSGCTKIKFMDGNGTHAKVFRVNANLRGESKNNFRNLMFNGNVEIWDFGKCQHSFLVCEQVDEKSLEFLRVLATGYMKHIYKQGLWRKISLHMTNDIHNDDDLNFLVKNYKEIRRLAKRMMVKNRFFSGAYRIMQAIGYKGFKDATKKEMEDFRRLLAYDMLYHKQIKNDKATRETWAQMTDEEKNFLANELNIKALKIAKKSGEWSIQKLVAKFIENNIIPHPEREKLLYEGVYLNPKYNNIKFAQFFVQYFNEIMEEKIKKNDVSVPRNMDFSDYRPLDYIYTNFDSILKESNKMVVTNLLNQRFELDDCEISDLKNCNKGNEELLKLCSKVNMTQKGFEALQELYEQGKKIANNQILKCREDKSSDEFSYEMIYKDNPIGLVLGNITNCCQRYDEDYDDGPCGYDCVIIGETNPKSCFVAFKYNDKIIAQSWLWYNETTKTVALDNIEVPRNLDKLLNEQHSSEFLSCLNRLCDNIFIDMNRAGSEVKNIIIGAHCTDIQKLENTFNLVVDKDECQECDLKLPTSSREIYSDAVSKGQFVVYKDGKYAGLEIISKPNKEIEKEMGM